MKELTRRQETAAVRRALKEAGYQGIEVRQGQGTAWGWIQVTVTKTQGADWRTMNDEVRNIVIEATQRDTEYTKNQVAIHFHREEAQS